MKLLSLLELRFFLPSEERLVGWASASVDQQGRYSEAESAVLHYSKNPLLLPSTFKQ